MKNKIFAYLITILYLASAEGKSNDFILEGYYSNNAIKEFKIIRQNTLIDYEAPRLLAVMTRDSNNYFWCNIKIDRPQYVDIIAGNLIWKAFIFPSSHQTFVINEQNQLVFKGDSSHYSNCINELQYHLQMNNIREPYFNDRDKIEEYLAKVDSFINTEQKYINNYEKNKMVKLPFLNRSLCYHYAHLIYIPFIFDQIDIKLIPKLYEKILSKITFNHDDLVNDFFYTNAARDRYILLNTKIEDVQQNFSKIHANIAANTSGITKDYLISSLVTLYVNNSRKNADHRLFLATVKDALSNIKDSVFIAKIQNNYTRFLFIDKSLPNIVLDETILVKYNTNERLTLRNVLTQYLKNGIYLDFWASWCAPCRLDIKQSEKSKLYLKNNNIITLYISIDSNHNLWKKASNDDNIQNNQFLLDKGSKSMLAQFLSINSIPRYVTLNSEHRLININAPRLNESSYNQLVQTLQSFKSKKITYD